MKWFLLLFVIINILYANTCDYIHKEHLFKIGTREFMLIEMQNACLYNKNQKLYGKRHFELREHVNKGYVLRAEFNISIDSIAPSNVISHSNLFTIGLTYQHKAGHKTSIDVKEDLSFYVPYDSKPSSLSYDSQPILISYSKAFCEIKKPCEKEQYYQINPKTNKTPIYAHEIDDTLLLKLRKEL